MFLTVGECRVCHRSNPACKRRFLRRRPKVSPPRIGIAPRSSLPPLDTVGCTRSIRSQVGFAMDSPLEEDGFEPSVPLAELSRGTKGSNPSLSRRTICLTIEFPGYGGKPPDIRMALAVALRVQRCGRSEDRSLLCWRNRRAGRGPACRKTRIAGLMYPPQVCHEAHGMALNLTVLAGSGTR